MRASGYVALLLICSLPLLRSWGESAQVELEQDHLWIPMRDGVKLAADLVRHGKPGRLPTVLIRTPYGKDTKSSQYYAFVERGYNIVYQNVRGRFGSEGTFAPLTQESSDGDDTITWIAAQPWSDGKVAMTGSSYLGFTQWDAAVLNNPHLKAIFPVVSGDDAYRDRFYSPGGAMKWGHRLQWIAENMHVPGYEAPPFQKYIWTLPPRRADAVVTGQTTSLMQAVFNHPAYDSFWKSVSTREKLRNCKVPVFSVGGWYDNYVEGDLDAFSTLRKQSASNHLLIGPWPHNMSVQFKTVDLGNAGPVSIRRLQLDWFNEWLKGTVPASGTLAPLRIFVMGANQWRNENEWPLARAVSTKFYLGSAGHANSLNGDGVLFEKGDRDKEVKRSGKDRFVYDPKMPVLTLGGPVCCNPKVFPWGPMDQRAVEKREDVLVYTTPVLDEDFEATGPIKLVLYASTSAPDTDFTAKLVDVYPDGRAINLTDGILRARYRDGLDKPRLLKTTGVVRYTIDAGVTSNLFRKGHRIRLEVSSSNFPRFDRNPNTGRAIADETQLRTAEQTIYHDRLHRSYLDLPMIPKDRRDQPASLASNSPHRA